jgi:hypothetical protein
MLAVLLNPPRTEPEWLRFSFNHSQDHLEIIQAIRAQKNVSLNQYPIEPMSLQDLGGFLIRHAQYHQDFNGTLGLPANDLTQVDPKDPASVDFWIFQNFQEHQTARAVLKI